MGDAAGVGPEVVMKALAHREVFDSCRPLVIGDVKQLARAGKLLNLKSHIQSIQKPQDG